LGAAYMLWLYQRTMFGEITNPKNENLTDLNLREFATFVPLLILAFWIGLYPKPILDRLETSVDRVMVRVNSDYTPRLAILDKQKGEETSLVVNVEDLKSMSIEEQTGPARGGSR